MSGLVAGGGDVGPTSALDGSVGGSGEGRPSIVGGLPRVSAERSSSRVLVRPREGFIAALGSAGRRTASGATGGSGSTDPVPSGTIWFDTRAGGAQDLQAVTTLAAAQAFFNDGSPSLGSCCFFTTNYDGAGTHALRFEWVFTDNVPHDYTREIAKHLTDNTVTDLYVQYKSWLGRTATGGGIGTIGSFIQANPAVSTANRKAFRNVIETGGGGCTDVYNGSVPFGGRISDGFGGDNNYASGWDNSTFVGQIIVSTFRVKVGSAGHLEVWKSVGGTQLVHYDSGANKNVSGLWHHAFQFPSTMNTPAQDQSDYYWDIVAWTP